MDKRDIPKRLTDVAAELATPSKPPSAWMDELDRAQRSGKLVILSRGGKRRGARYTTERYVDKYILQEYRAHA